MSRTFAVLQKQHKLVCGLWTPPSSPLQKHRLWISKSSWPTNFWTLNCISFLLSCLFPYFMIPLLLSAIWMDIPFNRRARTGAQMAWKNGSSGKARLHCPAGREPFFLSFFFLSFWLIFGWELRVPLQFDWNWLEVHQASLLPTQHTARPHFAASCAFRCDHSTEFRPMECGWKWCRSTLGLPRTLSLWCSTLPLAPFTSWMFTLRATLAANNWKCQSLHQPGSLKDCVEFLFSGPPWTLDEK